MDKDILRHANKSNLHSSVSKASFGEKPLKNKDRKSNTLLSFLKSEKAEFSEKLALEENVPTEKPKLYEPFTLLLELITMFALLIYFCLSANNVFLTVVLISFSGLIIPGVSIFFFYRLNTRWKMKTSLIIQLFAIGIGAFLVLRVAFDKIVLLPNSYANLVSPLKSVIEICVVLLIIGFALKGIKHYNVTTVLLVSCIVSAGFSASKSIVELFEVMFVRVNVANNGVTSAVGAIINNSNAVELSIKALINNLLNVSVFKPAIFISLAVINGFALRYLFFRKKGEKSPLGLVFLFLFSIIMIAFSSLKSSINFLQVLYVTTCVLATGYALYNVIEHCVNTENYI